MKRPNNWADFAAMRVFGANKLTLTNSTIIAFLSLAIMLYCGEDIAPVKVGRLTVLQTLLFKRVSLLTQRRTSSTALPKVAI